MKSSSLLLRLALLSLVPMLSQCASVGRKGAEPVTAATVAAPVKADASTKPTAGGSAAAPDDLDEYAVVEIADPLEKLNRGTFWVNDKLYLILVRPLSKGYVKVLPKPVRKGIDNAFVNVRYPVRLINSALQGKFKNAGLETEKFLLNTVAGIGGIFKVSDKFESLAALPEQDTGKTFAVWGMGHGAYVVLPFYGPSSIRDGFGLAGDYAMNPLNWGIFWSGDHDWTRIPPAVDTLRLLPLNMDLYDNAKADAIDPYIAIRSAYVQLREETVKK